MKKIRQNLFLHPFWAGLFLLLQSACHQTDNLKGAGGEARKKAPAAAPKPGAAISSGSGCADIHTKNYLDLATPVSWECDVLPMLSSKAMGKKYQCTVCHAAYKNQETLARKGEITRIISSLRSTGSSYMPREGDDVPNKFIVMLKRYERQIEGFQPLQ